MSCSFQTPCLSHTIAKPWMLVQLRDTGFPANYVPTTLGHVLSQASNIKLRLNHGACSYSTAPRSPNPSPCTQFTSHRLHHDFSASVDRTAAAVQMADAVAPETLFLVGPLHLHRFYDAWSGSRFRFSPPRLCTHTPQALTSGLLVPQLPFPLSRSSTGFLIRKSLLATSCQPDGNRDGPEHPLQERLSVLSLPAS